MARKLHPLAHTVSKRLAGRESAASKGYHTWAPGRSLSNLWEQLREEGALLQGPQVDPGGGEFPISCPSVPGLPSRNSD